MFCKLCGAPVQKDQPVVETKTIIKEDVPVFESDYIHLFHLL